MSEYCLHPNLCGLGTDCSKCYENEIQQLKQELELYREVVEAAKKLLEHSAKFEVKSAPRAARLQQALSKLNSQQGGSDDV